MGYISAYGPCVRCKSLFGFNPLRVPSIVIEGRREPICPDCVKAVNPERIRLGNPPIVPFPDAYEPIDEHELP